MLIQIAPTIRLVVRSCRALQAKEKPPEILGEAGGPECHLFSSRDRRLCLLQAAKPEDPDPRSAEIEVSKE